MRGPCVQGDDGGTGSNGARPGAVPTAGFPGTERVTGVSSKKPHASVAQQLSRRIPRARRAGCTVRALTLSGKSVSSEHR